MVREHADRDVSVQVDDLDLVLMLGTEAALSERGARRCALLIQRG
jgi:hypothetical protein